MGRTGRRGGTLRAFASDRRGVVAVEFAMVGMMVVELVLEGLQGGLFLYQQAELERVTAASARLVMVGTNGSSSQTGAQFQTSVLCPMLPVGMPCSGISVDAEVVSQDGVGFYGFAKTDMSGLLPAPAPGTGLFCTGSSGSVVYLRVTYTAPAVSPAWRAMANATGVRTPSGAPGYRVSSYAAFRNEPFTGGATC